MWVLQKYGISQILQTLYSMETNNSSYLAVPGDGVLNLQNNKCEWIKNIELVKLYKHCIHSKQTTALT